MGDNIYKIQWDYMTNPVKDWSDQKTQEMTNLIKTAQKNTEKDFNSRKNKIYKGQPDKTYQEMLNKDSVQTLQQQLRSLGYDIGNTGADGILGRRTKAALAAAEKDGYVLNNNKLIKPSKKSNINASMAGSDNASNNTGKYSLKNNFEIKSKETAYKMNQDPNKGYAFYISYPEHSIGTKGTGFEWMGGTFPLLKGHAASIIVDKNGNATYHTYGRYGDMGSYKTHNLPSVNPGEDHQSYLKRVRKNLEYADTNEPVNATYIPSVDSDKSRNYYKEQPQKGNYSLSNGTTCAGEACRGINIGAGINGSEWYDFLGTPEFVKDTNYSDYKTYSI